MESPVPAVQHFMLYEPRGRIVRQDDRATLKPHAPPRVTASVDRLPASEPRSYGSARRMGVLDVQEYRRIVWRPRRVVARVLGFRGAGSKKQDGE